MKDKISELIEKYDVAADEAANEFAKKGYSYYAGVQEYCLMVKADLEELLNEGIRERCEMDSLKKKDSPECAKVLGRCMICPHYSESIAERT